MNELKMKGKVGWCIRCSIVNDVVTYLLVTSEALV